MRRHALQFPSSRAGLGAVLAATLLAGCAVVPDGPSRMALPGTGRTLAQFQVDDDACRRFAIDRSGGRSAQRAAQDTVAGGAIAGAAIGALAGAAIGGSHAAGVGAGTGLLFGSAIGSGSASGAAWDVQRRYDDAYVQCMYASGHKVPVPPGSLRQAAPAPAAAPVRVAPPGASVGVPAPSGRPLPPPPPPGMPPPPPPSWRPG